MVRAQAKELNTDFWKFWTGQVISVLGTSFTQFAVPLLIFKLTHSAINLALSFAAGMLPYLLFGLVIGAWVDRLDRKRLMIMVDLGMALVIGSIPLVAALGRLTILWIYGAIFVNQTLFIFFSSAEFAAIPSLVGKDDLVTANGRIQASYFAATVIGPLIAGALAAFLPIPALLLVDSFSYLVSALALALIRISFNPEERRSTRIREDVVEGLRYVLGHPVLRNISAMMALVNFVSTTTGAQLVLYAKERLHATNPEVGLLFAAEGVGAVIFSLAAGRLRKRWSFSAVALTCLALNGLFTVVFALVPWYWLAVPVLTLGTGVASLFNINTSSLRQAIVPNHLLGRVVSIASVLAWSAIPLGALLGGVAIQWTHNVVLIYAAIGALTFLNPVCFSFTALGHADRYLSPPEEDVGEPEAAGA
jgi:MFS family permease